MSLPYYLVDVFAEEKLQGNQLAVFIDEKGISSELMQRIAKEMNFSETTFIVGMDLENLVFKVRIFTTERELPFAGHPTLGTAFVIQQTIIKEQIQELTLDLKAGMIPVTFQYKENKPDVLWMKQLNPVFGKIHPPESIAGFLGLTSYDVDPDWPIQEVSTGVAFFLVPLKTREALIQVQLDKRKIGEYNKNTEAKWPLIFCKYPESPENNLKVRMITSHSEDPATGSANGCLAGYLAKYKYFGSSKVEVRVEQGAEIGRPSLLYLKSEDHGDVIDVYVGGKNSMVAKGELFLD